MENYADRKWGSDIGLYSSSVKEQLTPYAKPMECGNHEDVRWVGLSGNGAPTLLAQAADDVMQFSALPYTDEVMNSTEYSIDLPKSDRTVLVLAAKTLGVGSAGCGPRPLPQYQVFAQPATFSYVLRLLPTDTKDLAALARTAVPADRVKPALPPVEARSSKLQGKVIESSSFQPGEGEPSNAVDGDPDTFWHSQWSPTIAKHPQFIVIEYPQALKIGQILYTARTGNENGRVRDYEIYLSTDGKNWGEPAAKGSFRRNRSEETITLSSPVEAKYLKFVALSEMRNQPYASIAEVEVVEAKAP
jgi:beta-galactosidase